MRHSDFKIEYFDIIDSTNTELKRRATQGAPSHTVFVADEQTGGRGRMGRSFFSPRGSGLYMSILLRPVRFEDAGRITTFAAVAVCRALERFGVSVGIKWVNDILARGRKLCGILCEAGTYEGEPFAVLGIGINIRQTAFPPELADIATSIETQTGRIPHRDSIIQEILNEFSEIYGNIEDNFTTVMGEYRNRCVTLGKPIRVIPLSGAPYDAFSVTVDDEGCLLVRTENHPSAPLHRLSSAEISVREVK